MSNINLGISSNLEIIFENFENENKYDNVNF